MEEKQKMMVCKFCGGYFGENSSKCPYCGSTNIKGAEAEYMKKLDNMRSDMEELGELPIQETKKEAKKLVKFVIITTVVVAVILAVIVGIVKLMDRVIYGTDRDFKADYEWELKNFPIFDELYEKGDDKGLCALYIENLKEDTTIYNWEHYDYLSAIFKYFQLEEIWKREKQGIELVTWEWTELMYMRFTADEYAQSKDFTDEEKERLAPYIARIREDADKRWEYSESEWKEIREKVSSPNGGYLEYRKIEEVVKEYLKEKK